MMTSELEEFYRGKKVFVTGDTGFKGSWLSLLLKYWGSEISGYGLPPKTEEDNFNICKLSSLIMHTDGDIRCIESLENALMAASPDVVFHFAAQPLVIDSYEDPRGTFEINIMGTVNLLEACKRVKSVKSIVIITTDKCYENREWTYAYRENDPLGGYDPYSASKAGAEIVTNAYSKSFFSAPGTASVATCRAGNVIGGGDWSRNRLVPDCIRSLRQNHPVVIRNPDAIRPWQYVLEPLFGYMKLAEKLYHSKEFSGSWNFGPYQTGVVTVLHLVNEIIRCYGSGEYVVKNEEYLKKHEASLLQLDITKAVCGLGWRPVLDFQKSIDFTVNDYKIDSSNGLEKRFERIEQYLKQLHMDLTPDNSAVKECVNLIKTDHI